MHGGDDLRPHATQGAAAKWHTTLGLPGGLTSVLNKITTSRGDTRVVEIALVAMWAAMPAEDTPTIPGFLELVRTPPSPTPSAPLHPHRATPNCFQSAPVLLCPPRPTRSLDTWPPCSCATPDVSVLLGHAGRVPRRLVGARVVAAVAAETEEDDRLQSAASTHRGT